MRRSCFKSLLRLWYLWPKCNNGLNRTLYTPNDLAKALWPVSDIAGCNSPYTCYFKMQSYYLQSVPCEENLLRNMRDWPSLPQHTQPMPYRWAQVGIYLSFNDKTLNSWRRCVLGLSSSSSLYKPPHYYDVIYRGRRCSNFKFNF